MGINVGPAPERRRTPEEIMAAWRDNLTLDGAIVALAAPDQGNRRSGQCWKCGDVLPRLARFCIVCGAEQPAATGPTTRLESE